MTVGRKNVIFYLAINVRVAGEGAGCERWWITAHTEPKRVRKSCESVRLMSVGAFVSRIAPENGAYLDNKHPKNVLQQLQHVPRTFTSQITV